MFAVKLLHQNAKIPTRGSRDAAGYDLYSLEDGIVPARGKTLLRTGISIAISTGYYGRVAARSGIAHRWSINIGGGVIDSDYRGEVFVLLFNHGEEDFVFQSGDRIAQLVLEKIITPEIMVLDELPQTFRAEGGFGSTGA